MGGVCVSARHPVPARQASLLGRVGPATKAGVDGSSTIRSHALISSCFSQKLPESTHQSSRGDVSVYTQTPTKKARQGSTGLGICNLHLGHLLRLVHMTSTAGHRALS